MYDLDQIVLNRIDNVAVITRNRGERTERNSNTVPVGHKIALHKIMKGEPITKLGTTIGIASKNIRVGEHVHLHNVRMPEQASANIVFPTPDRALNTENFKNRTFAGYVRPSAGIGTRNYIGILPTVNCSASVARLIADQFRNLQENIYPNIDGVVALTHGHGCSVAAFQDSYRVIQRTLSGYARHPNFGGVLIVGLGCEDNPISSLKAEYNFGDDEPIEFLEIQSEGGTRHTIEKGVRAVKRLLSRANQVRRQDVSISELKLALQCGGSDGFSAITANPSLGVASDILVACGGASILSETSEIFGAEASLKRRAVSNEVENKLDGLIRWWTDHAQRWGGTLNENPTPGNNDGGITTIIEKSLGSVAKSGFAPLSHIIGYSEPLPGSGLTLMDSPGNDPVSVTGQVASGANIVAFTTGRGSVFGFKPVPSLKLATTSDLYRRMNEDMDIDCGQVLEENTSIEQMGEIILEAVIRCASGEPSKSELLDIGSHEMVPWMVSGTI